MERQSDIETAAKQLGLPPDDPLVVADLRRLANTQNVGGDAPPGWYRVPGYKSRRRYWDGESWTDHWHRDNPWSGAAQVGMGLAVLIPFVGFLMGLALVAGRDHHGHWVVLTSVGMVVAWVLLVTSGT